MTEKHTEWRWYHAVAFYVVVQVMTFGLSGLVAIFQLKDSRVALTAATFQALWNKDDFYQVGPFAEPGAGLVKKEA